MGRKLAVVLDRPLRKRCEFLTVLKQRKGGGAPVEQLFFRTESGIRAHRSRARVELLPSQAVPLTVAIDSGERYPWRFPGATVLKRKLAAGDYALLKDGRTEAVVERKSFDNLLGDIGAVQALHHLLADLASLPAAALVIEAQYADFLDDSRLKGRWPAGHLARVLAELQALHPRLPIVYAGNRKLANAWCLRYFGACMQRAVAPQLALVREAVAAYGRPAAGVEELVRRAALDRASAAFSLADLSGEFAEVPKPRLRRILAQLEEEGLLVRTGRGRGLQWVRPAPLV